MKRNFCHLCGAKLEQKEESLWWCPQCEVNLYANPKPCVELALFNSKGELLIAKRGIEPYKGKYDLPGGFVNCNETYEEALLREVEEELALRSEDITVPRYVTSFTGEYPFGKEVHLTVVAVFWACLKDDAALVKAQDDVEQVEFHMVDQLRDKELSLPNYLDIIKRAVQASEAD